MGIDAGIPTLREALQLLLGISQRRRNGLLYG